MNSNLHFQAIKIVNGEAKSTRNLTAKGMNAIYTQFNSYGKKGGVFVESDAATSFGGGYWQVDGAAYVLKQVCSKG